MLDVISRHWDTFYRFDTGQKMSVIPRYLSMAIAAGLLTLLHVDNLNDFISMGVSVLAIFVGFSFALLFFIVDASKTQSNQQGSQDDLEDMVADEKLSKLRDEIFHNLSYFNFVSLAAVVTLLAHSFSIVPGLFEHVGAGAAKAYSSYLIPLGKFFAFFLVLDALGTFYRVVRRITFYFTESYTSKSS